MLLVCQSFEVVDLYTEKIDREAVTDTIETSSCRFLLIFEKVAYVYIDRVIEKRCVF